MSDFDPSEWLARITRDPDRRSGKPCIRDLRIPVRDVLDYLASGRTEAELLSDFPELEPADLRAAKLFAAQEGPRPT